jgi:hypothetical protein
MSEMKRDAQRANYICEVGENLEANPDCSEARYVAVLVYNTLMYQYETFGLASKIALNILGNKIENLIGE